MPTGHQRPNYKPDAPEADRIQAELDAEKERKETHAMIYRDERHQHTFEKEAAMRPDTVSRTLLAAPVSYTHLDVYKRQFPA